MTHQLTAVVDDVAARHDARAVQHLQELRLPACMDCHQALNTRTRTGGQWLRTPAQSLIRLKCRAKEHDVRFKFLSHHWVGQDSAHLRVMARCSSSISGLCRYTTFSAASFLVSLCRASTTWLKAPSPASSQHPPIKTVSQLE